MSDGEGDSYMTESAKEPIRDEEYFEHGHSSPHNPPNAIPDSASQVGVDLASDEDVTVVEKFVRIDPDSKWILTLPDDASHEEAVHFANQVHDWWNNKNGLDFPIMVIGGDPGTGVRLVRVDEHEIGPEFVDCGAEHCPGHVLGDGERCCEDLYCDCEPDGDFAGQDYRCSCFERGS